MPQPPATRDTGTDAHVRAAEAVVADVLERFHPRLALACSFQKEESVLLHMLTRIAPDARAFTIDTGVLFPETLRVWAQLEQRFGVKVEIHDASSPDGRPWSAERCCGETKVAALGGALEGLDAWVTGLRREQAPTRAGVEALSYDERRGIWKASPLVDWSERDVWRYIHAHELPYNALHDEGYGSIGCVPCTAPGAGREGRWAGEPKTECGIHVA